MPGCWGLKFFSPYGYGDGLRALCGGGASALVCLLLGIAKQATRVGVACCLFEGGMCLGKMAQYVAGVAVFAGEETFYHAAEHGWYFGHYKCFHDLYRFLRLLVGEACLAFKLI